MIGLPCAGNFQPIQPNIAGPSNAFFSNCAQTADDGKALDGLQPNTKSCVTTVIDRFSTSFNWTEVNFGSIWLRPWFYLFLNSAMTDQLFGGLTFVTAGSWIQVPPGYFSLAKNNLFVGTSQYGEKASKFASRAGPIFAVDANTALTDYGPCAHGDRATCNLEAEGVGIWQGAFQPKRMINIYDGPHFADGNLFVNIGAWQCDRSNAEGKQPGQCKLPDGMQCGIYSSTMQPAVKKNGVIDPHAMMVLDAPIGWKQPNGFYYPPAFAYRGSAFFKTVPAALKDLNMCYSFGPEDGFKEPSLRPGGCRHNVVDRVRDYISGSMRNLAGGSIISGPPNNPLPLGPIDFTTILTDLDGSLTGATGVVSDNRECPCNTACTLDGHAGKCGPKKMGDPCTCLIELPTTSLSRNCVLRRARARPGRACPSVSRARRYQFVTSVMAQLRNPPTSHDVHRGQRRRGQLGRPRPACPRGDPTGKWGSWAGREGRRGQVCDARHIGLASARHGHDRSRTARFHAPSIGPNSSPPGLRRTAGAISNYIDTQQRTHKRAHRRPPPAPRRLPLPQSRLTPNQRTEFASRRAVRASTPPPRFKPNKELRARTTSLPATTRDHQLSTVRPADGASRPDVEAPQWANSSRLGTSHLHAARRRQQKPRS
jgi:hypothetical protein